jgi:uncharacterized damage-inducible protein DinB
MELLPVIREELDYNYWARDRQLQACASLSDEQFTRRLGGSLPSVRETLAHLLAVEWLWLERWRGRAPKTLIPLEELPTLAAMTERWGIVEREMRDYCASLDGESLSRPTTCVSTRGQEWTYPLWRMMTHLLYHQSYHRGQVTTQLRMLGVQPPKVDFLDGRGVDFGI